jgi:hypothetical protein
VVPDVYGIRGQSPNHVVVFPDVYGIGDQLPNQVVVIPDVYGIHSKHGSSFIHRVPNKITLFVLYEVGM